MSTLKLKSNTGTELKSEYSTIPNEALDGIGGVIGEMMNYTLSIAPRPNRALAFAGALAFLSHVCARRWRSKRNARTPLYVIGLGNSGVGKDAAQKVNEDLAVRIGMQGHLVGKFKSGESLEDAMLTKGRLLSQYDEIDTLFRQMGDGSSIAEEIMANMLALWSKQGSFLPRRLLAQNADNAKSKVPPICYHPCLSVYGCAVPLEFYQAINGRMAHNGLFARLLIIHADPREPLQDSAYREPPEELISELKALAHWNESDDLWMENKHDWKDTGELLEMTEEAGKYVRQLAEEVEDYYEEDEMGPANALWGRALEKVERISMIFALSREPYSTHPRVDVDDVHRAHLIVWQSTRFALELLGRYASENEYQKAAVKIKEILRPQKALMPHSALLKKSHLQGDVFAKVIETLIETDEVILEEGEPLPNGVKPRFYRLGEEV